MQCNSYLNRTDREDVLQIQASGQTGDEQGHQNISAPLRKSKFQKDCTDCT